MINWLRRLLVKQPEFGTQLVWAVTHEAIGAPPQIWATPEDVVASICEDFRYKLPASVDAAAIADMFPYEHFDIRDEKNIITATVWCVPYTPVDITSRVRYNAKVIDEPEDLSDDYTTHVLPHGRGSPGSTGGRQGMEVPPRHGDDGWAAYGAEVGLGRGPLPEPRRTPARQKGFDEVPDTWPGSWND